MTKKGELQGAAFCATNNSIHTFYGVRTIHKSPPRFDNIKDKYDSKKPAPTSYNPKDYHRKKALAHVRAKAARFSKKDYFTFSPGPGTYSHQSEFCDRPSETFDALSQSSLTKNSSTKDKPRKDQQICSIKQGAHSMQFLPSVVLSQNDQTPKLQSPTENSPRNYERKLLAYANSQHIKGEKKTLEQIYSEAPNMAQFKRQIIKKARGSKLSCSKFDFLNSSSGSRYLAFASTAGPTAIQDNLSNTDRSTAPHFTESQNTSNGPWLKVAQSQKTFM